MNTPTSSSTATSQANQIRLVKSEDGAPPQLITLSHLQNFLPIATANTQQPQDGNQVQGNTQQQQQQQQGKIVQAQTGVVSVGLPQQFLQVSETIISDSNIRLKDKINRVFL